MVLLALAQSKVNMLAAKKLNLLYTLNLIKGAAYC
jgi:hypothetical protein